MSPSADRARQHDALQDGAASYRAGRPAASNPHDDFEAGAMWAWGWHVEAGVKTPGLRIQTEIALGRVPPLLDRLAWAVGDEA